MNPILSIVFNVFGVIGGICGIWSLVYTRQQTKLMAQDIQERKNQDAVDADWAIRYEKVVNQLRKINPHLQVQEPGVNGTTMM
jgi:hypothetical protein